MYTWLRKSLDKKDDKGFTLIELLVVIIIIGILAAIAIPIFLSQRKKAIDASMKSDLRSIATQMETAFTDTQAYPAASAVTLTGASLAISPADTVRMSPNNTPKIFLNTAGDAFCIEVTNPNSTRTAAVPAVPDDPGVAGDQSVPAIPAGAYVWMSNAGGLQSSVSACGSGFTTTDLVAS